MRKIVFTLAFALMTSAGYSQTIYDALLFSENDYEGTARSVAMGNAFTALGGDLGSVTINPAGSAVAKYSQISITPALTFSTNLAQGVSPYEDGSLPYFEKQYKNTSTNFSIPSLGMTFSWDTNRKSGLKNVSFGFVMNRSNSWNEDLYAAGRNSTTSFMGAMATNATNNGYLGTNLNAHDAYDYHDWKTVVGYQSGMISTFGGYDDQFVGASELIFDNGSYSEIALGGPIDQTYGRRVKGSKYDYAFNLAFNISDFLYVGANLGISSMSYGYSEYFKEEAIDPADFEIDLDNGSRMYFDQMRYKYNYEMESSGCYGKFGIILTPGFGLRLGAAIQTPVVTTIREIWQHAGETQFTDSRYDASASSPYGEDTYSFRQPYRANFGIAFTLDRLAVISADYELCDYSTMKFRRDGFTDGRDYFEDLNEDIRNTFGMSHMVRAGLEIKPVSTLALRAGYGLATSPEMYDYWGEELPMTYNQNVSFGLGFSSKKSFFADVACRYAFATDEYFMPYDDYIFDADGYVISPVPEILNRTSAWKVLLTFGWRF